MNSEEKTEQRSMGKLKVTIVTSPLTKEEAREMFSYRPHNKYSESRFGGNNLADDFVILLNKDAIRCKRCQAPTRNEYLSDKTCPDCDGRSEYNGTNPRIN